MTAPEGRWPTVVLTVSDGAAAGVRDDDTGAAVAELLDTAGPLEVTGVEVLADEADELAERLRELADGGAALIVTNGGTGLGPRDVTPEATRAAIDREVPGLAEAMRAAGRASTPLADLSRGVCGARGRTLICNLPGSPRGAVESLQAIVGVLDHALRLLSGDTAHRAGDHGAGAHGHDAHHHGSQP